MIFQVSTDIDQPYDKPIEIVIGRHVVKMSRCRQYSPPGEISPNLNNPKYWIRVNDNQWMYLTRNAGAVYQHIVEELPGKTYSEFDLVNTIKNLI